MNTVSRDQSPSNTAVTSDQTTAAWNVERDTCGTWTVIAGEPDTYSPIVASIWPGSGEREAHLIAAAPDMLAALRELHKKTVIGTDAERHAALHQAWAAISRAERVVGDSSRDEQQ